MFAVTMRRVLIDHARKRTRRQRILFPVFMSVEECMNPTDLDRDHYELELLELLNRALEAMVEKYPVHAKLVELKVFGGETIESCAELLGISQATVQRHWRFSKAWLIREIKRIERDQN
jgi:RNA polymerase sigma factor (sigma-70 family)